MYRSEHYSVNKKWNVMRENIPKQSCNKNEFFKFCKSSNDTPDGKIYSKYKYVLKNYYKR